MFLSLLAEDGGDIKNNDDITDNTNKMMSSYRSHIEDTSEKTICKFLEVSIFLNLFLIGVYLFYNILLASVGFNYI